MAGLRAGHVCVTGQWLNWQSSGLQNRRLGVRFPPGLPSLLGSGFINLDTGVSRKMSANASTESSSLDILKWGVVFVLVGAGVAGNAYFAGESLLYRILALLVLAAAAGFVALQTTKGRNFWQLLKDARTEIRKVIWPTKAETRQTTLIVMAVVVMVGLLLWALDSVLSLLVSGIIG